VDDERRRLEDALDEALMREAQVKHVRFSPTTQNPRSNDPRVLAAADAEAARETVRTLVELDEGGSSRN
jgi:hypothetical protein